jgi:hypothetical protein
MKAEFVEPQARTNSSSRERIIVSCGIGQPYIDDFSITTQNCDRFCPEAWKLYYSDYPEGCPSQSEQQYAFKVYALDQAIQAGFRYILWIDSSLAPVAPITPLWERVAADGWYAAPQFNGITTNDPWRHWASEKEATLAEWCSDKALSIFGIARSQTKRIPIVLTGLVGLDMLNPLAARIWITHKALYEAGVFNGPHANHPNRPIKTVGRKFAGHVSNDPGVLGHRHDETSLSFILHVLGLKAIKRGFLTLESRDGFIAQFLRQFPSQARATA